MSESPIKEEFGPYPPGSFPDELQKLINYHSLEGGSNTPDFILATYLLDCLETFDKCICRREEWYGRPSTLPDEEEIPAIIP